MKILLLTPIISQRDLWGKFEKGGGSYFPIGLLYIAGAAREAGHQVDLLDASTLRTDEDGLVRHLEAGDYGVIGFGNCYTAHMHAIHNTAKICKRVQPNAKLVVGGTHPTLFPKETMERFEEFDALVFGEGEATFTELLEHYSGGASVLPDIKGITYRSESGITSNPARQGIKDMGELPELPYDLLDVDRYEPPPSNYRALPTFAFIVSRGCPYKCSYCDVRVHGRRMRYDDAERAVARLKYLKQTYGMKGVYFLDSIMTVNRKFTIELCKRMVEEKLDLQWSCSTRVNCVDPELLGWMKKAGCWNISFGLESGNDESLKRMNKAATTAQAREAVKMVKQAGIQITGYFILCLPGEDEAMTLNTVKFAKELKMNTSIFFLPVPFPGTELYEQCKEIGGLRENIEWEDYKQWMDPTAPLWVNPLIGKERMLDLYNMAIRAFYLSPSTLIRTALNIKSPTELKKYAKGLYSMIEVLKESIAGKSRRPRSMPEMHDAE